jgi:hypothetical protein
MMLVMYFIVLYLSRSMRTHCAVLTKVTVVTLDSGETSETGAENFMEAYLKLNRYNNNNSIQFLFIYVQT